MWDDHDGHFYICHPIASFSALSFERSCSVVTLKSISSGLITEYGNKKKHERMMEKCVAKNIRNCHLCLWHCNAGYTLVYIDNIFTFLYSRYHKTYGQSQQRRRYPERAFIHQEIQVAALARLRNAHKRRLHLQKR